MGIQSTRTVTREEAENILVEKRADEAKKLWHTIAQCYSNTELEDAIEGTFDNYSIVNKVEEE